MEHISGLVLGLLLCGLAVGVALLIILAAMIARGDGPSMGGHTD